MLSLPRLARGPMCVPACRVPNTHTVLHSLTCRWCPRWRCTTPCSTCAARRPRCATACAWAWAASCSPRAEKRCAQLASGPRVEAFNQEASQQENQASKQARSLPAALPCTCHHDVSAVGARPEPPPSCAPHRVPSHVPPLSGARRPPAALRPPRPLPQGYRYAMPHSILMMHHPSGASRGQVGTMRMHHPSRLAARTHVHLQARARKARIGSGDLSRTCSQRRQGRTHARAGRRLLGSRLRAAALRPLCHAPL